VRSASEARRIATGGTAAPTGSDRVVHTVRRGDTLWRIARLYQTSVGMICSLNDISRNATLYPGVKLTVGYR
jgi:LysM repeat protein